MTPTDSAAAQPSNSPTSINQLLAALSRVRIRRPKGANGASGSKVRSNHVRGWKARIDTPKRSRPELYIPEATMYKTMLDNAPSTPQVQDSAPSSPRPADNQEDHAAANGDIAGSETSGGAAASQGD